MAEQVILGEMRTVRVQFTGLDADQHLIDLRELSISLGGMSKMLVSSSHLLFSGEVPSSRIDPVRSRARFYAAPIKEGCIPVDIVIRYATDMFGTAQHLIAAVGTEIIQRLITVCLLSPSGRAKEMDAHFDALMGLTKKIQDDGRASQEMMLAHMARSEERFIGLVRDLAQLNSKAAVDAVHPIGRTCAAADFGNPNTAGLHVDIPTAQSIRSKDDLEIGDMQTFRIRVDGLIAHNRTAKIQIDGSEQFLTADLADPVAHNWPDNIYKDSIRSGVLEVTAKPTLKDGKITRLAIFNAKQVSP